MMTEPGLTFFGDVTTLKPGSVRLLLRSFLDALSCSWIRSTEERACGEEGELSRLDCDSISDASPDCVASPPRSRLPRSRLLDADADAEPELGRASANGEPGAS